MRTEYTVTITDPINKVQSMPAATLEDAKSTAAMILRQNPTYVADIQIKEFDDVNPNKMYVKMEQYKFQNGSVQKQQDY